MRKLVVICALFISAPCFLHGQLTTDADFKRQVYDYDMVGGLHLHTRGYGLNFRKHYHSSGYVKQGFEIEIANLRHEKEVKSFGGFLTNSRGFVFNRLNTFYTLRGGYIREKTLFDKTDQGSVSIGYVWGGGLSLGLLKPVYLEYARIEDFRFVTTFVERFDPTNPSQNASLVQGQANFTHGLFETKLEPGLYMRLGLTFDYHQDDSRINAIELGVMADAFRRPVPIIYDVNNPQVFFQVYLNVFFGRKWN